MEKVKLIQGIGINDASYPVVRHENSRDSSGRLTRKITWRCPFYVKWSSMLRRCYSKAYHIRQPTYKDCSVCDEWLLFSNFRKWMSSQDWVNKQLDKDLLFPGNKIYSPKTCVLISPSLNKFLPERNASRGEWPIGVYFDGRCNMFVSKCNRGDGKYNWLGYFETPEQAHEAWRKEKLRLAKILSGQQEDSRIAEALINRYENYKEESDVICYIYEGRLFILCESQGTLEEKGYLCNGNEY